MRILDACQVSVELGNREIVRNVSFGVDEGEVVVILGPNGAGKSTLLGVLAGDLAVSEGEVALAGRRLGDWRAAELARHRAVMPQRAEVNFPLTVEEVVRLGRPPEPETRSAPVIDELLDKLDVTHLRYRRVPSLSGGEQQRVQLARVLAQVWDSDGPVLLLLDECSSALDPSHQQQVFRLLKFLAATRGYGVLAVVHDLNLAARFADRLLLLREGSCYLDDVPAKVLTPATLQAVYRLPARVLQLPEGYPLVIPTDASEAESYWPEANPNCRQAS